MSDAIPRLRRRIVEMAHKAKEGHVPSALSILDVVYLLHSEFMKPNDRFVLSKGHGCLALYAVLAECNFIPSQWLDDFCVRGAKLQGHPERGAGTDFSTGSLGHGICGAVGMAYAKKVKGEPGRIYCLIGDGEAQEGSVFEALRLAHEFNLDNLSVIVDLNEPEREKHARRLSVFCNFTWQLRDGHDHDLIRKAFWDPFPIIFATTVKGHGIEEMEADPRAWHHRNLGLGEILERLSAPPVVPVERPYWELLGEGQECL